MKKFSIALFLTVALLASAACQTVMNNQNLVQFTSGVVNVLTANNQDLSACLTSEKQVAQVIFSGIQAFEQKNEQGFMSGLSIIESSFETIAQTLKTCDVLAEDVQNFVNKIQGFSNIKNLIFEAGKSLIVNDVEIFQEIDTAITDYKNQEYTQSGEQFGYALEKIFQNSVNSEAVELITIPSDVKIDATAFLIGFLESLGNQNDISSLTDIATCVTPNAIFGLESVVYSTINQVENTTDYTQVKPIIVQAIQQLGQAFEQIPEDLVSCGISQTLIDRVKQFVALCKNSKQLESTVETNWKKNWLSLLVEAGSLVNDIQTKNWENIGKDFGNVVDQVLLTQTSLEAESSEMITIPSDVKIDATAFLIGFLESLGNQNDIGSLTSLVTCVTPNAVFSLESVIYTAISQIENTTDYTLVKQIVVETIKQLGQALQSIPDDLVSCGISETLIDRVKEFVTLCKNTKQLEATFDSNWKKNILSLILEVGSIISDVQSKNWENIGKDFGTVVEELLLPSQTQQMTQFFSLKQTAQQITVDPQNFILGTLIGLTGNQKVSQLFSNTECLAKSEISQIKEPIANIITLIKNKNYLSIVTQLGGLLKTLVMSVKTLPDQLSGCGVKVDVVSSIKSNFEKLKNPVGLAKAIFSDIMTDKSYVLEYSSKMEQSVEKNDWMSVGMFFGQLLEKMFIEPQSSSDDEMISFFSIQTEASQISGYAKDLFYGIVGGISSSDDADALFSSSSCALMNDFDQMLPTLKNMFNVIKEKDYAELITYLIDLVKGVANEAELLTLQMKQCGATDAQMAKMTALLGAIKDPKRTLSYLWGNINSNQLQMMQLFKQVFSDAKSKNILQVGYDLGEILAQIYFGQNAEDEYMSFISVSDIKTDAFNDFMFVHNAILDFSLGFIGGYANNADFQSLVTAYGCMEMNHINLLVDPVKSIMGAIKTKNWEGIITNAEEIIVDISTLMQNIPDQLLSCGITTGEQAKFEMLKNSFKNPLPLLKFFFNNIKSNGQDLFLTAEQMIVNFQSKDFNNAGWQFGTIMQYVLMGKATNSAEEMISFLNIQDGVKKVETEAETVVMSIKDKATTVGLGFISGLSESQQAQNIFNNFPCLLSNGFTNVIPAFENVVNSIKQKQVKEALTNLMAALESVFYAYINVPTTLQICGLDEQDVEILANYINVFQQPIETFKLIQGNVKQNEVELLLLVQQMFQSIEKKDLQGLGLYAGLFYDNVFLGPTQPYEPSSNEETMMLTVQDKQLIADGKQFLTGFFNGLKMENVEQSVECVGEEEIALVLTQFKSLVSGISQNINIFNIQSVLTNALSSLTTDVQKIKNMPNELIQCGLTKQSISSLTQIFDLFENKANFEQAVKSDIEQNGLNMLENVFTVVENFNEQNWSQVGQGLGSMLYEISQIQPTKQQFKFLTK